MLLKSPENYITCLLTARVRTRDCSRELRETRDSDEDMMTGLGWPRNYQKNYLVIFIKLIEVWDWLRFFYNTVGLINALIEQLEEKLLILSGGFAKWFGSCWTALKFLCKDLPTLRDDCGVCINTEGCRARVYQVRHNNGLMIQLCQSSTQARTRNVCQNLK